MFISSCVGPVVDIKANFSNVAVFKSRGFMFKSLLSDFIRLENSFEFFSVYDSVQVIKSSINFRLGLSLVEVFTNHLLNFFVSFLSSDSVLVVLIDLIPVKVFKIESYYN